MRPKYLRFEQMEVFRPMPVPDALKRQIRQESEKAKALADESGLSEDQHQRSINDLHHHNRPDR